MEDPYSKYRIEVSRIADQWLADGLPSRQALLEAAEAIDHLRERLGIGGMWENAPCMVTVTIDDGLGQGIAVIERFAKAIGIRVISLGLLQTPATIIDACRQHRPNYLGLTILQFDSEAELSVIARNVPESTRIVAGGPVFSGDPDFARRTGTHFAAKNVAHFLRYMVDGPTSF